MITSDSILAHSVISLILIKLTNRIKKISDENP